MTEKEALKVLGLSPDADEEEIKKRYRRLMMQVHPDIHESSGRHYTRRAQSINHAYGVLKRKMACRGAGPDSVRKASGTKGKNGKKSSGVWNAPVNPHAYTEREILHYAEDPHGSVLGSFSIARGKYLWRTEEDFPLFLLSLYQCGKELLDEIDLELRRKTPPADRRRIHGELTYLLAQQFIDGSALLKEFAKSETRDFAGNSIFYMPAMLEFSGRPVLLRPGESLSPAGMKQHRLYLKNQAGQILGYLSFADDRLYYIVIPLFEQKTALVKIQAAKKQPAADKESARYQNLRLFLKPTDRNLRGVTASLNLQIERALEEYR